MKKLIAILLLTTTMVTVFAGCTRQSGRVSHNISQQADNFNVTRRLAVLNARSDEPIFELIGNFALSNSMAGELEVIVETAPGVYKKHFVYLNEWTIYVVIMWPDPGGETYHIGYGSRNLSFVLDWFRDEFEYAPNPDVPMPWDAFRQTVVNQHGENCTHISNCGTLNLNL